MNETIEIRSAHQVDVNFPKRMIELIVMPYESPGEVEHRGRLITEVVSRGAFANINASRRRISVNRDHLIPEVIGKAVALHPSRQEGLVAEIKISGSDIGERSLIQASEGLLDASAGFMLKRNRPDAEVWETRNRRRLNHLWLHHIALTPDPVYEDARVLAVRNQSTVPLQRQGQPATPNIDLVRGWQLEDAYARLGGSVRSR
jgi:HK97 family phage prohead protease